MNPVPLSFPPFIGRFPVVPRFHPARAGKGSLILAALLACTASSPGAIYTVNSAGDTGTGSGTSGDLRYCLTQANLNAGSTINVNSGLGQITLTKALPLITASVTLNSASQTTISGNNLYRIFFVDTASSSSAVSFTGLNLVNGYAKGGDGGSGGGGGGLGAGGAIFVNSGAVTLTSVNFTNNSAQGGDGGTGAERVGASYIRGGGGGGLGGNGGKGAINGSGGGGGFGGNGGNANSGTGSSGTGGGGGLVGSGGNGIDVTGLPGGGGGGGLTNGANATSGGGGAGGTGGGNGAASGSDTGGGNGSLYGGGGGGTVQVVSGSNIHPGGNGGNGGKFGGGGGGGGYGVDLFHGGDGGDFGGGGGNGINGGLRGGQWRLRWWRRRRDVGSSHAQKKRQRGLRRRGRGRIN